MPSAGPRVWPVFATYGAVLLWVLVANAVVVGAWMAVTGEATISSGVLVGTIALTEASLVVTALLACRLSGEPPAVRLRTAPGRLSWRDVGLAVLGLLALGEAFDLGLVWLGLRYWGSLGFLQETAARMSGVLIVLMLVVAGPLAAGAEELFFRGFVQTRLAARFRRWPAIGVTAAGFALFHLDPVHAAFALAVGLYLGWLTELAGNIRPAIGAHLANNVVSLLQTWWLPAPVSVGGQAGLLAVCLALAVVTIVLLRRRAPPASAA
jgi:membrane protease YdiL (CAAX protease family)